MPNLCKIVQSLEIKFLITFILYSETTQKLNFCTDQETARFLFSFRSV